MTGNFTEFETSFKIGNRKVCEDARLVIAEAEVSHFGDLDLELQLVDFVSGHFSAPSPCMQQTSCEICIL